MNLLLVKLSSLGDVVHTFPAITDAAAHVPGLKLHWLVEEAFVPIVAMHPAVAEAIPVRWRAARRTPSGAWREIVALTRTLRARRYDVVLDAQGLIKSAIPALLARAPRRVGLSAVSAREPFATLAYHERVDVPRETHAIDRLRRLFADALGYETGSDWSYGLKDPPSASRSVWLLHGSTWPDKLWPERFWAELARDLLEGGDAVMLPWGNDEERARAGRIAAQAQGAIVAPALNLDALAAALRSARAVVAVDSGLGHLAAALGVPVVGLFGPTDAARTGLRGARVVNLTANFPCAPCIERRCGYRGPPVIANGLAVVPPCFSSLLPAGVRSALHAVSAPVRV
jgi:heptosyltransferase-1